jgi:hypothetical protein
VLRVFERCRHGIGGYSHAARDELSFVLCPIVEVPVVGAAAPALSSGGSVVRAKNPRQSMGANVRQLTHDVEFISSPLGFTNRVWI